MRLVWQQLTLMLITVMYMIKSDEDCPLGWFGENCRYKCRCSNSDGCSYNGECDDNGPCVVGFFGPGCQYVDLLNKHSSNDVPFYIRDADETTCNPEHFENELDLILSRAFPFMWFRLHVNYIRNLLNFTVILNSGLPCSNERRFRISTSSLDVSCDTNILLKRMLLRGAVVSNLCSVYISGGRNVAIKQDASQSSNDLEDADLNKAENAVDGNSFKDYRSGTCSCTDVEIQPSWNLKYNRPQIILRATLHNRFVGTTLSKLSGFTFLTISQDDDVTNIHEDTSTTSSTSYDVFFTVITAITSIKIRASSDIPYNQRVLALCEVETFGETICPDGSYGLWCTGQCRCLNEQMCSTVSGSCSHGCNMGMFGYNCSSQCSKRCFGGACLQRKGACFRCTPGFLGAYCDMACDSGYHGLECLLNCSEHCADVCDPQTGYCRCKEGYSGLQCTECPGGKYGEKCRLPCPKLCLHDRCHIETGMCISCTGNRIGFGCEDCPEKMYGAMCFSKCSEFCINETCDQITGNCSICTHGYSGEKCRIAPYGILPWNYYFIPMGAVIAAISCACICWTALHKDRKKLRGEGSVEGEDDSDGFFAEKIFCFSRGYSQSSSTESSPGFSSVLESHTTVIRVAK